MSQIQLPKLRKINVNRPKKKKIFLLSDDVVLTSGISTMSRELVLGTLDRYDWVQLASALKHPEHGKVVDMSSELEKETGLEDVYMIRYCHTGYGDVNSIREILHRERPDAMMIFTDPRFWQHVFLFEYELHTVWKIPLIYLNVWDNAPIPNWNFAGYRSCDLIMNISKQTHALVQGTLNPSNFELI
jgi:hypothetical protein